VWPPWTILRNYPFAAGSPKTNASTRGNDFSVTFGFIRPFAYFFITYLLSMEIKPIQNKTNIRNTKVLHVQDKLICAFWVMFQEKVILWLFVMRGICMGRASMAHLSFPVFFRQTFCFCRKIYLFHASHVKFPMCSIVWSPSKVYFLQLCNVNVLFLLENELRLKHLTV